MLALIAAMSQNRAIGKNNRLPWRLPSDLHYFKALTTGKTVVMGRKTFESIGHALPCRKNIVITRQPDFKAPDIDIVHSLQPVLEIAASETVFIIGGSQLYQQFLPYADQIYLTLVEAVIDGDVFFPEFEDTWQVISRTTSLPDRDNLFCCTFLVYQKKVKL